MHCWPAHEGDRECPVAAAAAAAAVPEHSLEPLTRGPRLVLGYDVSRGDGGPAQWNRSGFTGVSRVVEDEHVAAQRGRDGEIAADGSADGRVTHEWVRGGAFQSDCAREAEQFRA